MISVIMPTIWVGQSYIEMLPLYQDNPLIEEIIFIDNDASNVDDYIFNYSKLVYLPQKENIYVNPAWNLGAKLAKCDILCFASDDISIDLRFLDKALAYLTPKSGMLGLCEDSIKEAGSIIEFAQVSDASSIEISEKINPRYATFFMTHKESYHHIPDDLKIHYGDVYLYDKNIKLNKPNYELKNACAITMLGTSSNFFKEITKNDCESYKTHTL